MFLVLGMPVQNPYMYWRDGWLKFCEYAKLFSEVAHLPVDWNEDHNYKETQSSLPSPLHPSIICIPWYCWFSRLHHELICLISDRFFHDHFVQLISWHGKVSKWSCMWYYHFECAFFPPSLLVFLFFLLASRSFIIFNNPLWLVFVSSMVTSGTSVVVSIVSTSAWWHQTESGIICVCQTGGFVMSSICE